MEFLKKTLDILENVMLIVAELDPGQKPSISEDLGDLRLMRKQLSNECGGETNHDSSALPLHGVSNSDEGALVCECIEPLPMDEFPMCCDVCGRFLRKEQTDC